jgi:maltooligosyltrehalose trehalohydrolase
VISPIVSGGYGLDAQWCDDFHHSLHVLLTGEQESYYVDYGRPEQLARAMVEGYSFQGEYSTFRRRRHGVRPGFQAPERFVVCAQNHDQIGNRRAGERLSALLDVPRLRLAAALLLLSPTVPLIFMGEEYGETAPFPYFVDHSDPQLLAAIRAGRAAEFGTEGDLLDPGAEWTFLAARPDRTLRNQPAHAALFALYGGLIALRAAVPLIADAHASTASDAHAEDAVIVLQRSSRDGSLVSLFNTAAAERRCKVPRRDRWRKIVDCGAEELGGAGAVFPDVLASGESLVLPALGFVSYLHLERTGTRASLAG